MSGRQYWLGVACVVAAATWLNWPVIDLGYTLDDYAQAAMVEGLYPVDRAPWDLYTFSDGSRREVRALVESGFYPWWAHPEVRLSMFRPLASLLRAADRALFGNDAYAQHLHSLAHWLAMLLAVALLFASVLPRPIALLAALMFALDQAHPITLGWLANRTSIIGTCFGALSLTSYLRFRRDGKAGFGALACACYCIALLSGEYGFSFLGLFIAYEWLGRGEQLSIRARRLAWILVPALVFVVIKAVIHPGARHSEMYLDPLGGPGLFAEALLRRWPVLMADGLLSLRSEYWSFGAPFLVQALEAGLVDNSWLLDFEPWRRVHEALAWGAVVLLLWAIAFVARRAERVRGGNAVWLAAGAILAALPLPGSLPTSRLVLIPAVGIAALLATLLSERLLSMRAHGTRLPRRLLAGLVATCIVGLHLVAAPLQARDEIALMTYFTPRVRRAILEAPFNPKHAATTRAVIIGTGDPTVMIYTGLVRKLRGLPVPKSIWVLSGNRFPFTLTRDDERTLSLRYLPGGSMLTEPFEWMFRSSTTPLRSGQRFALSAMTVEVLEVESGRPTALRFTFEVPLEDPSLTFWTPASKGLLKIPPPAIGQSVPVPAPIAPISD